MLKKGFLLCFFYALIWKRQSHTLRERKREKKSERERERGGERMGADSEREWNCSTLFAVKINQAFVYRRSILMSYSLWNNQLQQDENKLISNPSFALAHYPGVSASFFLPCNSRKQQNSFSFSLCSFIFTLLPPFFPPWWCYRQALFTWCIIYLSGQIGVWIMILNSHPASGNTKNFTSYD